MARSNPAGLFYSHHENYGQSQCKPGHLSDQVCELRLRGIWHAFVLEHAGMINADSSYSSDTIWMLPMQSQMPLINH